MIKAGFVQMRAGSNGAHWKGLCSVEDNYRLVIMMMMTCTFFIDSNRVLGDFH